MRYAGVRPRTVSDNGPQFIAKDFKELIRISGVRHARTSPHYPQSSGKIERWRKSLKGESIRPGLASHESPSPRFCRMHVRPTPIKPQDGFLALTA